MKTKENTIGSFPCKLNIAGISLVLGLSSIASDAAVIWTFDDSTGDTIASAAGSFATDITATQTGNDMSTHTGSLDLSARSGSLAYAGFTGVASATTLVSTATLSSSSHTGTFGHDGVSVMFHQSLGSTLLAGTEISSTFTPTITWNGKTITDLFGSADALDSAVTAWTLTGGTSTDVIQYINANPTNVPEPSSTVLLGLSLISMLARRKKLN